MKLLAISGLTLLAAATSATAQDAVQPASDAQAEARPTGLPAPVTWTFHFDAGWGSFGFANSLFDNPKEPGVEEDLSDQWFEGYIKPALSGVWTLPSKSQVYGTVSAVAERTYGSVPEIFGEDVSSFGPEDLSIGWRSGTWLGVGEDALDFSVGRQQYRLGHGLLLSDGAAEGGSRGGYWTNARKAFELAAVGRFRPGPNTFETFYLDKDELDEGETGSRLWGLNYEFAAGANNAFGASYMKWFARADVEPGRDGLDVFNVRAYTVPIASAPELSFEFEYVWERNQDALHADGWTLQGAYELRGVVCKPKLTYRHAAFQGDDPDTSRNEAFDPLFLGFYDWGTWWQGEIAGEYFLSNSNVTSHMGRVHLAPTDTLGTGVLVFKFDVDQPRAVGPTVTATDAAIEFDAYADWQLNTNVTISLVGAFAAPGEAVTQATGRTMDFGYGMVYVGYRF